MVAIKKYYKIFSCTELSILALREIKIMKHFNHPNLLSLFKIISPPNISNFTSLYIVIEKLDMDLLKLIKTFDLSPNHTKLFVYQLFRGLKCLHSGGVVHRYYIFNFLLFIYYFVFFFCFLFIIFLFFIFILIFYLFFVFIFLFFITFYFLEIFFF